MTLERTRTESPAWGLDRVIPGRLGLSVGPAAVLVRPRAILAGVVLALATVIVVTVSVGSGTISLSPDRVIAGLLGLGDDVETLIVSRRAGRALVAVLVGFCLGAAGGITQSLTRNPLASPDILGVTSGASLFAVLVIVGPLAGVASALALPVSAIVGALLVTLLIVALAWRGGIDPFRLVLVGLGVTALASALTEWLLMRAELEEASVAMHWLAGSVAGATLDEAGFLAVIAVLGTVAISATARSLAAIRLGPQIAQGLGVRTTAAHICLIALAVVLVACATAVAGPVGFVAFVAPQVAMRLSGSAGPPVLAGGLFGALLVSAADLSTRILPVELPVGIITSLVGAPVLLVLLFRSIRKTSA